MKTIVPWNEDSRYLLDEMHRFPEKIRRSLGTVRRSSKTDDCRSVASDRHLALFDRSLVDDDRMCAPDGRLSIPNDRGVTHDGRSSMSDRRPLALSDRVPMRVIVLRCRAIDLRYRAIDIRWVAIDPRSRTIESSWLTLDGIQRMIDAGDTMTDTWDGTIDTWAGTIDIRDGKTDTRSGMRKEVRTMALVAIMSWYIGIGVLAAIGTVAICRARFSPRVEHIFFSLALTPIAAMYLAFVGYFGDHSALRPEAYAVVVFAALGLLGLRLPALLLLGYALHGAWDLFHEIGLNVGTASAGARTATAIPLAYGVFCAAYDWFMVGYFYTRRAAWRAAAGGQR